MIWEDKVRFWETSSPDASTLTLRKKLLYKYSHENVFYSSQHPNTIKMDDGILVAILPEKYCLLPAAVRQVCVIPVIAFASISIAAV